MKSSSKGIMPQERMTKMKWIILWFIVGCAIISSCGCMKSQKIKFVTDIPASGDPTFHTEYIAEF